MNENTLERTIYKLIEKAGSLFGDINGLWDIMKELEEGVSYYREKELKDYVQSNMRYAKMSAEELIKFVIDFEKEMENDN